MRVLYFGTYDRAYPRNAQVISALRGAGVEVREQHLNFFFGQNAKAAFVSKQTNVHERRSRGKLLLYASVKQADVIAVAKSIDVYSCAHPGSLNTEIAPVFKVP